MDTNKVGVNWEMQAIYFFKLEIGVKDNSKLMNEII